MENKIDISVIIPMYNSAKYIEETIASIVLQAPHHLKYEIIIVDDVSKDNSREVVKNLNNENIRLIELEKNGGTANARNTGIRLARGEWIQFVDSDDKICNDLYAKFETFQKPDINCYVFSVLVENYDHNLMRTISKVKDKRAFGYFYTIWNKFIRKEICIDFVHVSRQNEDVCFIFDMMNAHELKIALIPDAYYIYNCKNEQSKMANFKKNEYRNMYAYVYSQINKSDDLTKMFFLETFVGIVFSKGMPFFMSLGIGIKTLFRLFKFLPKVYSNGIRNCISNTKIG